MGNRISGYTQTYQVVRKTRNPSANTPRKENRSNSMNPKGRSYTEPECLYERPEWALTPAQPQEKTKQSEPLYFPLERALQGSGQDKSKPSVKQAEQQKRKKQKQTEPPQTKPKQKPAAQLNMAGHVLLRSGRKRAMILLLAVTAVVLLASIGALLVVRQYIVTGFSMEPTLMEGDKLYYTSFQDIAYGDIVIFDTADAYGLVVKRVVGLPGDKIHVNADGTIVRNLVLIDESYIQTDALHNSGMASVTVEDGKVFLMGDNRAESIDSRDIRIGQIPINTIEGKVRLVVRGVG